MIYWICGSILAIALIAGVWVLAYYTWFDRNLRVIMFNSKSGMNIFKTPVIEDNRFRYDGGIYMVDKKAIYRRYFRIPYALYFYGNPNPMMIEKQVVTDKIVKKKIEYVDEKDGKTKSKEIEMLEIVYTAQELHNLLEVNFTMNLIKPPTNIKKIAMTIGIIIVILVVLVVILHFTGVIDIRELLGLPQTAVKK